LSNFYSKKRAPFSLIVFVNNDDIKVRFMKDNVDYPYANEMQTN